MADGNSVGNDSAHAELDRNSYNAAFYELGFRWHWDSDTYRELLQLSPDASQRIHHYLATRQPHLLRAYDAEFLVDVIQKKHVLHRSRNRAAAPSAFFDWSQTSSGELGA